VPRYFTLKQAEQLLPDVEPAIREAIALKSQYQAAETDCQDFQRRISTQGGTLVDPSKFLERKQRRDSSAQQLKRAIEKVQELGCLVKDLDIGLIDFPTLLRGQEVYLCWKLGEAGIQFWHGVDEGFGGRRPIDRDFLDHHQGDLAN
jgi:hypothetical protein